MQKNYDEYIEELLKFYKIDKCKNCDCLQDELKRLLTVVDNKGLKSKLKKRIINKTHLCLGCKPCKPALLIGKFLSGNYNERKT